MAALLAFCVSCVGIALALLAQGRPLNEVISLVIQQYAGA